MNFIHRYIEYLKRNPEGYWFKRKAYGWGWVPAMWQGWLMIITFLAVLLWILVPFIHRPEPSNNDVVWFLVKTFGSVVVLILVCHLTGEPPKWQWGIPQE